jgi:hypothetical protein
MYRLFLVKMNAYREKSLPKLAGCGKMCDFSLLTGYLFFFSGITDEIVLETP